jgi:Skp family chaperone for outer membrane proteins
MSATRARADTQAEISGIDFEGVLQTAMKRTLVLALAAGLATSTLAAQTAPAPAPAAAAPAPVAAPPQAIPAKIAIIAFQTGMASTNEGARAFDEISKKYAPQKAKIDAGTTEVENLRKQLNALPATAPDDQRAKLTIDIDTREKQLNLDIESAQTSYNTDLSKVFGELQQKFGQAAVKYCADNGFTMLVTPESSQNSPNPILWWNPTTDITQAVINAYNASSGVAAPPSAPARPRSPAATTPHPAAPAAPKKP